MSDKAGRVEADAWAPSARRYAYFDHDADIGVIGYGGTLEEAFEAAAAATFALMANPRWLRENEEVAISFSEEDVELALVEWLNALLAAARQRRLALARFALRRDGARWHGTAWGERWSDDVDRGVEVKGATLTLLSVRQTDDGWEARCVVDV